MPFKNGKIYQNNGFYGYWEGGCCRAKYYDWIQAYQKAPTSKMTSINTVPGGYMDTGFAARLVDFESNTNCQILRDNFASYDEYFNSKMIKCPCGAGGVVLYEPSGKENTYNLYNCTFIDNAIGGNSPLYPAANYAASISLNAPKLGEGNWWLPSVSEMVEMMHDITYGTSFWNTNPDIVNRVLTKLNSVDSSWSMLSASVDRWTSSVLGRLACYSSGYYGGMNTTQVYATPFAAPITIYEF